MTYLHMHAEHEVSRVQRVGGVLREREADVSIDVNFHTGNESGALDALNAAYAELRRRIEAGR